MQLIDLRQADGRQRRAAAAILRRALAHAPSAWHDDAAAAAEVATFVDNPNRLALLALANGRVRGWIGAIRHSEHAWEMHPLVVDPDCQGQVWGRRLVHGLEAAARAAGVVTIWLGTDDDFGGTSIYGQNLYPDVLAHLQHLHVTSGHPLAFYMRLGYAVTGVLPDVNGPGRHDIIMAKRL